MSHFEYKVVPAPTVGRRRQRRVDGLDKYASTISDVMTELGFDGWDFVGAEVLRERRRRFLILVCDVERTLMIFRRVAKPLERVAEPADSQSARPATEAPAPVAPRRVRRPDLVEAVANGARRIPVTGVERPATGTRPKGGDADTAPAGDVAAE